MSSGRLGPRALRFLALPFVALSLLALPALVVAGCSDGAELTIYGAASLSGVLDEVAAAYEAAEPGTAMTLSTGSSAALATQIEQGAPADVFLSADTVNPQRLVVAGLADGAPITFAANRLAIIVPADDPAGIQSPADLARPGVRVIAAGPAVPISQYAAQLVENLAGEPGYPTGFAAAYAANIVSREDDVKAVVAKVALGEGDAAIVYATDARATDGIATVEVPASANVLARYDGIVVKATANAGAARAFLDWLIGPAGQAILHRSGFLPPPP